MEDRVDVKEMENASTIRNVVPLPLPPPPSKKRQQQEMATATAATIIAITHSHEHVLRFKIEEMKIIFFAGLRFKFMIL